MIHDALAAPATGALILERLPQVKARTGLSRSELYRRIANGDFPAQIKLGDGEHCRASAWDARAVDQQWQLRYLYALNLSCVRISVCARIGVARNALAILGRVIDKSGNGRCD